MEIDAETNYKICLFLILTCRGLTVSLIWTIQLLEQISIILKELFEYLKLYSGFFFFNLPKLNGDHCSQRAITIELGSQSWLSKCSHCRMG